MVGVADDVSNSQSCVLHPEQNRFIWIVPVLYMFKKSERLLLDAFDVTFAIPETCMFLLATRAFT